MKVLKLIGKLVGYSLLAVVLLVIIGTAVFFYRRSQVFDETLVIEADYMQYACGEDNDDSKIAAIDNKDFAYLIGTEVDPQTSNDANYNLFDYIDKLHEDWSNPDVIPTKSFRMKGKLGKYPSFGCDGTRKFIIEEISKVDGSYKVTY